MDPLILRIVAAANTCTLYPPGHPRVRQEVEAFVACLAATLVQRGSDALTLLVLGDELVDEAGTLRPGSLLQRQLVGLLKRLGIERLTLAAGLTDEEAHCLLAALATGAFVEASPHVVLGRVRVRQEEPGASAAASELSLDLLLPVKEAFARFRSDRSLPLEPLNELVWGLIDSLSRTTRSFLPLAKLKDHDEYTFVHSVNVATLVLAQARSFGIQGSMLHAFGMAGLLHDIGKLFVPLNVLTKSGKLEGEEWAQMQGHTLQGAWYLGEIDGMLPLAIAVAFEHHLRYDGQPNYPQLRSSRTPNLASCMTSIADAYDAMSTLRPYQQPLMRKTAFDILRKRSETFYDPLLAASFIRLVGEATGGDGLSAGR